jgi:hypothetical protein
MLVQHIKVGRTYEALEGTRWRVTSMGAGDAMWARRVRGLMDEDERSFDRATFAAFVVADVTPYLDPTDELLSPDEVAELVGVSIGTLANWRSKGVPARFLRAGITLPHVPRPDGIRYKRRDVEMFLECAAPVVPRPKERAA